MSSDVSQPLDSHPSGPPDVPPPSRAMRLLTSWKLWTLALVLALAAIGAALGMRGYQRYQALRYLEEHQCTYELTEGSAWITDWFGDWAKGFRGVDSIYLAAVTDESFVRISVFSELREVSTIEQFQATLSLIINGVQYDPGVVDTISDRGVDAFVQLDQLESLALNGGGFTDAQLARIVSAGAPLVEVKMNAGKPSRQTLEALTRITTLRSLEFYGFSSPSDEAFRGLAPIAALEELVIQDVGPECALWMLQSTHLRRVRVSNVNQNALQAISELRELEFLSFPWATDDVDAAVLARLVDLPRLETLEAPTSAITWESLEILRQMPSLERIVLKSGDIDDADLRNAIDQEWDVETRYPFGPPPAGGGFF